MRSTLRYACARTPLARGLAASALAWAAVASAQPLAGEHAPPAARDSAAAGAPDVSVAADTLDILAAAPRGTPTRPFAATRLDSATAAAESAWLAEKATILTALLAGEPPATLVVQSLFEVDLADEPAIARRREALRAAIADRRALLTSAGVADSIGGEAPAPRAIGSPGASRDSLEASLLLARNRVDALRLAFLRLPVERRHEINETEASRRRLREDEEAAREARRDAELVAAEAEERRRLALEAARIARSARLEQLTKEIARAETFYSSLAHFSAEMAAYREVEVERANAELQSMLEAQRAIEASRIGSPAVWPLFDRAVEELADARPRLRDALGAWFAPSDVPTFVPAIDAGAAADSSVLERISTLRELYAEIALARAAAIATEEEIRWQALSYRAERVRRTSELRVRALAKLPGHRRGQVLGLTRDGLRACLDEIDLLDLRARLYVATRMRSIDRAPGRLDDLFALGTVTVILLRTLVVLLVLVMVRRRGPRLLDALDRHVLGGVRDLEARRRIGRVVTSMRAIGPWIYLLVALVALRWAVGGMAAWPEVAILFQALLGIGVYKVALEIAQRFVMSLSARHAFNRDPRRLVKLFTTLRAVLRVSLVIAFFLILSERVLGRGFLYYLAVNAAWIGGVAIAFSLLHGWRQIISEAYIHVRPTGRLSALVRATRHRWYGFVVGGAAFLWLAGRAGVDLARDFALGFDRVRKALAFLFRKRVEKQAEARGYSDAEAASLPEPLLRAFGEVATSDDRLIVDHFPGLSRLQHALDAWCETGTRGAFLLLGERGMGKTSWLSRVHSDRVPETRIVLDGRVRSTRELWEVLVPQLAPGLDPGLGGRGLEQVLSSGKPRIVIVDGCHNLFLGTVGGYEAYEAFATLADATRNRVFWLCTGNANAWAHLEAVRPDLGLFAYRQELRPWTEEQIRRLIETRTSAAGVRLSYEDLVTDAAGYASDGTHTEASYMRLLWDYSDGNPRVALHFWLRSLVPCGDGSLHVRLFRAPTGNTLDAIGEIPMFLLASIVLHENLTVEEAAAATRYRVNLCRSHLDRLEEEGILEKSGHRYRLATYWHRVVIKQLRRGNMLAQSVAA
jgi:hypothetical protein